MGLNIKNRIGISLWNWDNYPDDKIIELMEKAHKLGFTAVEIPMMSGILENADEIRSLAKSLGLEITLCACMNKGRDISNFDFSIRENTASYFRQCIETASIIEAKAFVGPLYAGGSKCHNLSESDRQKEWELAVTGLRKTAKIANSCGVFLSVEPLHRYRTSVVNTAKQVLELVSHIDSKWVNVLFDTFHANIEEESICDALEDVLKAEKLGHFHACANHRGPAGTGHLPWAEIFSLLKKYDYQNHITLETFCVGGFDATWSNRYNNSDEVAQIGIENIKKLL